MKCNHCHENISPEGNLTPLFCPHCNHPWTKSQTTSTPQHPPEVEETKEEISHHISAKEEEEELANLRQRGEEGDKIALLLLGLFYFYGSPHTEENHPLSAQYYQQAFCDIPLPVLDQMRYYLQEPLPSFMLHHTITDLHTKALVGDPHAQIHVAYFAALCYPNTDFIEPESIFHYLYHNPDQAQAATPLAICHQKGIGTEKNPRKALEILKQAVHEQDPLAQYTMALWYQEGTLLPFDFPKAFHYASLSAKQDFPLGQILLGNMTFCGEAVKENHSLGLKYLNYSSSLQGDLVQHLSPLSQIVAPVMYPTGITLQSLQSLREEFPHISYFPYFQGKLYEKAKNLPKAKECYLEAAKHHLTLALYQLAKLEEASHNTENLENPPIQINETALTYHQEAANRYYAPSQTELGKYYLAPNPETQNIPLAMELFQKAALQHEGEASYQLGLLYLSGISDLSHEIDSPFFLEKNLPQALSHFQDSLAQNHFLAKEKVFALQDLLNEDK